MDIAIMIEGQNGLNWPRWKAIARAVEDLGFAGLYRSDHYTNANPPDLDSLELWVSLTWLASHTSRIEFGQLVSPLSFREPTMLARMAAAVDDLSGGRFHLGVGAGWQEREHHNFGWDLLPIPPRFDRFEEGLEIISRLLQDDTPSTFEGKYYQIRDAILLPHPARVGGPPIVIGGNGPRRTLPLAARFADEWNAVFLPATTFASRNERLDALLEAQGRDPSDVRRTMMTGLWLGKTHAELEARAKQRNRTIADLRDVGLIVGTPADLVEQLQKLADVGVQRVMLQWLDLEDLEGLEVLAKAVLSDFPSA